MKKIIIISVSVLVILALVISPFLNKKPTEEKLQLATFLFQENLQIRVGDQVNIGMALPAQKLLSIRLMLEDSILQTYDNPNVDDTLYLKLDASKLPVGTRRLNLISEFSDGTKRSDSRFLRVLSDIVPEKLKAEVLQVHPHLVSSFTQGLEFYQGRLFESTGLLGKSLIAEVKLEDGSHKEGMSFGLDGTHFGEGISILNDVIYQLTWQNQKCLTYDLGKSITPKGEFYYTGEGWGLTNDGEDLIMSNGTEFITFRDPKTFQIKRSLQVYSDLGPISGLNELEYFDGKIYANIWQSNKVVGIDPLSGKVLQEIDASSLVSVGRGAQGEVLNGIAFNKQNGKIYMTGKNWANLLEVRFLK